MAACIRYLGGSYEIVGKRLIGEEDGIETSFVYIEGWRSIPNARHIHGRRGKETELVLRTVVPRRRNTAHIIMLKQGAAAAAPLLSWLCCRSVY